MSIKKLSLKKNVHNWNSSQNGLTPTIIWELFSKKSAGRLYLSPVFFSHSISRGRLEESSAKFKYIKDLHEAYENWLMEKMFPYQPPILKVIDAHMKPEEIYQQIETIISRLWQKTNYDYYRIYHE